MADAGRIDWNGLATEFGLITSTGHGHTERGGRLAAQQALERLLSPEALAASVDHYVSREPGAELARSVLWLLHPPSAMARCHEIFSNSENLEDRRFAVELLRVVADQRVLSWVPEYLADADPIVQMWGIGIVEQLLFSNLAGLEDCAAILDAAAAHPSEAVREKADEIRRGLDCA